MSNIVIESDRPAVQDDFKSGAFYRRYSPYDPNMIGPITEQEWNEAHGVTKPSSGSGSFDVNGAINSVSSLLAAIFGKSDKYTANAYQTLYNQERKTNTMLWIGVGLAVLLAFIFLVRNKK